MANPQGKWQDMEHLEQFVVHFPSVISTLVPLETVTVYLLEILVGVDLILVIADHLFCLAQLLHLSQLLVNLEGQSLDGDVDVLPLS